MDRGSALYPLPSSAHILYSCVTSPLLFFSPMYTHIYYIQLLYRIYAYPSNAGPVRFRFRSRTRTFYTYSINRITNVYKNSHFYHTRISYLQSVLFIFFFLFICDRSMAWWVLSWYYRTRIQNGSFEIPVVVEHQETDNIQQQMWVTQRNTVIAGGSVKPIHSMKSSNTDNLLIHLLCVQYEYKSIKLHKNTTVYTWL